MSENLLVAVAEIVGLRTLDLATVDLRNTDANGKLVLHRNRHVTNPGDTFFAPDAKIEAYLLEQGAARLANPSHEVESLEPEPAADANLTLTEHSTISVTGEKLSNVYRKGLADE